MALSELQWPPSLPQRPLRDTYSDGLPDNTKRTEFDAGTPRVRKISSAGMESRSVLYVLDDIQRDTLKSFLQMAEARSFWWPDAAYGIWRYARVKPDNLEGLFSPWKNTLRWQATLTLEIWPYVRRH